MLPLSRARKSNNYDVAIVGRAITYNYRESKRGKPDIDIAILEINNLYSGTKIILHFEGTNIIFINPGCCPDQYDLIFGALAF